MRVSDADRAQIADRLAKHYGDGRLDQAEFELRLDKAMRATTVADLSGLLSDLPGEHPGYQPGPLPTEPRSRRYQRRMRQLQFEHERLLLKRERQELRRQRRPAPGRALQWIALFVAFLIMAALAARAIAELVFVCLVVGVIALLLRLHGGRGGGRSGGA
jgi:hypothetical protein